MLAFTAAAGAGDGFVWWEFVLQDVGVGLATGLLVAFIAARLMPSDKGSEMAISAHEKGLYGLAVAFLAYGAAVLPPEGNGFVSVFVAALALGIWRPDIAACFEARSEDLIEVIKLGVFLAFGAILTFDFLFESGWAAVAIAAFTLLVARPVAVFAALTGSMQVGTDGKAFMAWFGPKGVATMTFALFVLGSSVPEAELVASIAALTVFVSIIAHGLTDHAGAEWMARRAAAAQAPG